MSTATATKPQTEERKATDPMKNYLHILFEERQDFGLDPATIPTMGFAEAHDWIDLGKSTARKPKPGVEPVGPGYYVITGKGECEGHPSTDGPIGNVVECDGACHPETAVYVVVESKSNPGRFYAKKLVIHESGRATWDYAPGSAQKLAEMGLKPLTVSMAAQLGKKYGVCMVCGRTLTDDSTKGRDGLTSIQRGIGPVCAKRLRD